MTERRLRKRLTANDVGSTGSHQAGLHVPKSLASFFPVLDERGLNPDLWLTVLAEPNAARFRWRLIHYNNRVVSDGTRDEYRLTHCRAYLTSTMARPGDTLELEHVEGSSYIARIAQMTGLDEGVLVLDTQGPWSLIRPRRVR